MYLEKIKLSKPRSNALVSVRISSEEREYLDFFAATYTNTTVSQVVRHIIFKYIEAKKAEGFRQPEKSPLNFSA